MEFPFAARSDQILIEVVGILRDQVSNEIGNPSKLLDGLPHRFVELIRLSYVANDPLSLVVAAVWFARHTRRWSTVTWVGGGGKHGRPCFK